MLEALLGSKTKEQVLLFLKYRGSGFPAEIAKFFNSGISQIQKQLEGLENGGVVYSRYVGRTRLYELNPRYPFLDGLNNLLEHSFEFYDDDFKNKLRMNRKRPRKAGKPL